MFETFFFFFPSVLDSAISDISVWIFSWDCVKEGPVQFLEQSGDEPEGAREVLESDLMWGEISLIH